MPIDHRLTAKPLGEPRLTDAGEARLARDVGRSTVPGGYLAPEEVLELTRAALHELHRAGLAEQHAASLAATAAAGALVGKVGAESRAATHRGIADRERRRVETLREAARILQSIDTQHGQGAQLLALPTDDEATESEREHRAWLEAEARVLAAARDETAWPAEARELLERLSEEHDGASVVLAAASETEARLTLQGYEYLGEAEAPTGPAVTFTWEV